MSDLVPKLLLKLVGGVNVDVIKTMMAVNSVTIATPLGVPLSLNVTNAALFKVNGSLKVNNLPAWAELLAGFMSTFPSVGLELDLKPT